MNQHPTHQASNNSRPRKRPRHIRQRLREIERDAARRTLNGNGMNGSLPPLPVADEEDGDNDASSSADCGGGEGEFGTLFGHPYGALPYGNIHLAVPPASAAGGQSSSPPSTSSWHPDIVRHSGLGPQLRRLNDEQLLNVLSFVDGPTLAAGIIPCSKFMYVAGHHEELWRDLVLRRWGEDGFTVIMPPENEEGGGSEKQVQVDGGSNASFDEKGSGSKKEKNSGCWKDVYAYNHYEQTASSKSASSTTPELCHTPMKIEGIYSDTFFRSFLCRSFALQPSWLSTQTVPTLSHDEVNTTRFVKEYEETNTPLLIRGASNTWPALQGSHKWTTDYLLEVAKGKTFRATSGAAPLPAQFDINNYFNYCASSTEEAPLYLFDRTFAAKCPQLLEDFDSAMKETCPWWSRGNEEAGHDLFSVLGEGGRPDYQWLIVGPKRSGSCFHIDPNCTHAWNAPIIGRKRWIFYPPGVTPPGVFPSPDGDDVCMPISIGEWFLTFWDAHVERRSDPDASKRPLECTACPGDVLFVPHGWWHMVLNIGDDDSLAQDDRGVSVALTRNYVSASNLSDVLRFLDTRVSQISGCRDRGEAVPPEELGLEFRKALLLSGENINSEEKKCDDGENGSDKSKWTGLLERSEEKAKKGWGCAAWVDLPPSTCDGGNGSCGDAKDEKVSSSILSRAKQPTVTSDNACGMEGAAASSEGGFSFSFLS